MATTKGHYGSRIAMEKESNRSPPMVSGKIISDGQYHVDKKYGEPPANITESAMSGGQISPEAGEELKGQAGGTIIQEIQKAESVLAERQSPQKLTSTEYTPVPSETNIINKMVYSVEHGRVSFSRDDGPYVVTVDVTFKNTVNGKLFKGKLHGLCTPVNNESRTKTPTNSDTGHSKVLDLDRLEFNYNDYSSVWSKTSAKTPIRSTRIQRYGDSAGDLQDNEQFDVGGHQSDSWVCCEHQSVARTSSRSPGTARSCEPTSQHYMTPTVASINRAKLTVQGQQNSQQEACRRRHCAVKDIESETLETLRSQQRTLRTPKFQFKKSTIQEDYRTPTFASTNRSKLLSANVIRCKRCSNGN